MVTQEQIRNKQIEVIQANKLVVSLNAELQNLQADYQIEQLNTQNTAV